MTKQWIASEWWFDLLVAAAVLWLALSFWSCTATVETVRMPDSQPAVGELTVNPQGPIAAIDRPQVTGLNDVQTTITRPTVHVHLEAGVTALICLTALLVLLVSLFVMWRIRRWQLSRNREQGPRNSG